MYTQKLNVIGPEKEMMKVWQRSDNQQT